MMAARIERLVAAARAFTADCNNMDLRVAYMRAVFNHDRTAEAIVALADLAFPAESSLGDGAGYGTASAMANSGTPVVIIFSPPTEEEGEPISSRSQPFLAGQTDAKPSA